MSVSVLPDQAAQEHKLELYSIEEFIDTTFEQKRMIEQRMAIDLLNVALASNSEEMPFLEKLPLLGVTALMEADAKSDQREMGLDSAALSTFLLASEDGPQPFQGEKDLLEYLTTYMQPGFDSSNQSLKIQRHADDRLLLAYLLPEQHKWMTEFLEIQRQCGNWQAMVSASVYVCAPENLKELGLEKSRALALGTAAEIEAVREKMARAKMELLTSPKILTFPGKQSEVVVMNQMSYLADWRIVTVYPGPVEIADPDIKILEEGTKLKTRVLQVGSNAYGLSVSIEYSEVQKPIPTRTMTVGKEERLISLPRMKSNQLETTLTLPSGGGGLFSLSNKADPEKELVVLIEFQPVKTN